MSDRTESAHVSQPQPITTGTAPELPPLTAEQTAQADALLSQSPWASVTGAVKAALLVDYSWAVVRDGLPESEYLEGLVEWAEGGNSVESYLHENGLLPEGLDVPEEQ